MRLRPRKVDIFFQPKKIGLGQDKLALKCFNHIRTIRKYAATWIKCTHSQNHFKIAQKHTQSKNKTVHVVVDDLSFLLRGRDFL